MPRVTIVQSFDGYPIGATVELSVEAAESAVIQRRGVLFDAEPRPAPESGPARDEEVVEQAPEPAPPVTKKKRKN